jgi:hypothetical protein
MNKVFKVIWSKTKNCYVVASELAKSHTKAPSAKGISRVLVCGVLACVFSFGAVMPVFAGSIDGSAIISGLSTSATATKSSAWGLKTKASAEGSTAWGDGSSASGRFSTSWGTAQSMGWLSTAWGNGSRAVGDNSTAFGRISIANGEFATAFGYMSEVYGDCATAFGTGSMAFGGDSVAWGFGSQTGDYLYNGEEVIIQGYLNDDGKLRYRIMLGRDGDTTDLSKIVDDNGGNGYTSMANARNKLDGGVTNIGGLYATAFGDHSKAMGTNSFAALGALTRGTNSAAVGKNATSVGENSISLGAKSSSGAINSIALGYESVASEANTISVGHKKDDVYYYAGVEKTYTLDSYKRIVNMADGTSAHDASTVGQTIELVAGDNVTIAPDTTATNAIGQKRYKISATATGTGGATYTTGNGIEISNANAISAKAGTNVTVDSSGINVVGGATVASENTGLMTGANAYTELRPASNGTFVKTANTTKANLTALDTATKNAIKELSVSGSTLTYTKGDDSTGTVTIPTGKTYTAGNNIEISNTDVISASGNGTITAGNTGLVTGNTVYEALQNIQIPEAVQYTSGNHIMVGTDHSISALVDGTVASGNTGLVSGGQVYDALQTVHPNVYIAGNGIVINGNDNSVSVKNVVMYDSDEQDTATMNGTRGTRLTNLKAAILTQSSTDAVIGNQLWSVKEDITGFASDINRNKANITTLNQSVTDALSSVSAVSDLVDAIDSLKADASLNNLNNQGRAVIATAAADAVQAYMAEHSGDTGNTQARMMTHSLSAVNPGADTNYVVYDDADSKSITLEGPVGEGTKLTGLAEAELSASSTDAVTGSQLYATEQKFNEFQSALSENNSTIATMQTSVNTLKAKTLTMESDLNTAKTQLETGFNVTIGGAKVKTVNPDNNVINFVAGDNVTLTDDNGSIKISATGGGGDTSNLANKDASNVAENTADWGTAIGTGAVESGNGELVTGGTVFEAVNDAVAGLQDELAGKANTDMDNLTDTGKQNIKDLAKEAVKVKGSGAVTVTSTEENGATVYDVSVAADGKVEAGDTGIVTGGAVYDALTEQEQMITDKLDGKADKDSVYTKDETDAKLADKADKADLDAKADKSELDKKADKSDLDKKANKDASNIEVGKWADKLGVGAVEEGDGNLVTGDTVAKALAEIDGTDLIDQNGESIQIGAKAKYDGLDSVDISKSDGSGRVLRGVLVDPDDDTSAANVGYVKAVGEAISQGVNEGFQKMDDKINKTGAGAAALANLHPVDTDGDTKLNIAAGIGRYHGETAGALGLFYKPSERVVMNISSTIGNSDTMFGAGVSVAVDKPVAGGMSKAQLVKAVNAQAERIEQQDAKIQKQDAVNEALVAEIQQMKAEIAKLKAGNK